MVATSFAQCSFSVDVATSLSSYSSSVCVATLVLGCDHLAVCKRLHVVTLISWSQFCWWFSCLHNFQIYVATSWWCRDLFCFPFLFFRLQPQFHVATDFFLPNYFPGRDIKVMSRPPFLLLSSSLGHDLNEWCDIISDPWFIESCKLHSWAIASIWLQVATSFETVFGCTLNTLVFMSRHQVDVAT